MYSSQTIRKQFLNFFKQKKHKEVNSAPVIPTNDPTLLFTNAGMNQFKNIFLGQKKPVVKRMTDSQKCIRAGGKHNDLEEVGKDGTHHTFFEMLGNWSFGDYYKKEAILWAWELLTEVWELPKDRLYATVYKNDQEAYELWKENTDIKSGHIMYFGEKDNFWEMGEIGPCGPCSEIHFDLGKEFCDNKNKEHKCSVNGDCERYIELWNLVFIQYERLDDGALKPLTEKYVDTGAGLERLCQVLQKKQTNYETDLFQPLIDEIAKISGYDYLDKTVSFRVIVDHIRALSFAIADGGMPSNEGRGYVIRRILRRAARHGRILDLKKPFLYSLVDKVIEIMGSHYNELKEKKTHIKLMIKAEEERFNLTLDKGLEKFNEIVRDTSGKEISGKDVFMLYDTYGFPVDLSRILAAEKGLTINETDFNKEMQKQKQRAREAAKFNMSEDEDIDWIELNSDIKTEFRGYHQTSLRSKIVKYTVDDKDNVRLVLQKTPFYAESGGQIADTGYIYNDESKIRVTDVQKSGDQFIHIGKLIEGEINDMEYEAAIESEYRKKIAANHTATHLLHAALRETLGEHVHQKGSLVHPDYLRFDFTHFKQVSKRELRIIEEIVNKKIRQCLPLKTEIKSLEKAKKEGVTALFGEKYEEKVRVVTIGGYSQELCGGTHLNNTGEIGLFRIKSENSIAAGVRRIEAVTAGKAIENIWDLETTLDSVSHLLNTQPKKVFDKVKNIIRENKKLKKDLEKMQLRRAAGKIDDLVDMAKTVDGIKIVAAKINAANTGDLRKNGDQLKNKLKSGIGILFAEIKNKVSIVTVVTDDLVKKYQAGKIVNEIAKVVGGRGGGRPDMAMAGGKKTEKIKEAIDKSYNIIKNLNS